MKALESLIIDIYSELNMDGYGIKEWEDDSYNHILDTIEMLPKDNSLTQADIDYVIELLDDTSIDLQSAYFNVLDFLESKEN